MKTLAGILDETSLRLIEATSRSQINKRLTGGTSTGVAVICCSEMCNINSVFPADPKLPIFTWQNLGGCVDDCGGLEDLVASQQISDIIVYGHYGCEIIEVGLRSDPSANGPSTNIYKEVIRRVSGTRNAIKERFGDKFDKHVFQRAVEDFVLRELSELLKLPKISKAAQEGTLKFHAWINHDDTMENATYDPQTESFWVFPDDECH